jgi:hypothetical protein
MVLSTEGYDEGQLLTIARGDPDRARRHRAVKLLARAGWGNRPGQMVATGRAGR